MTVNMQERGLRPYFLWDEDISIAELHQALRDGPAHERQRLLGKMLREARDVDVWAFVTPVEVANALPHLVMRLGRRRSFWEFLIKGWRDDGFL